MKEQIEEFLQKWEAGEKDKAELKRLFMEVTGKEIEKCPRCETKALTEIRKYYHLNFEATQQEVESNPDRKYLLKPGVHQLAPGEKAMHTNTNTTDEQLEWYLNAYPHTKENFIKGA